MRNIVNFTTIAYQQSSILFSFLSAETSSLHIDQSAFRQIIFDCRHSDRHTDVTDGEAWRNRPNWRHFVV
jgi:hypothetical protein